MRKAILHCGDGEVSFLSEERRWVNADGDKAWEWVTGSIQLDLKPWGWRTRGHLTQEIRSQNCQPSLPQTTKSEQQTERRNSAFFPSQSPGDEVGVCVPDCCTRSSCSWCHYLGKSITFPRSSHCRWLNIEWVWVGWVCYSAWAETPWVWAGTGSRCRGRVSGSLGTRSRAAFHC